MAVPVDFAKMVSSYADGVIRLSESTTSGILWKFWHRKMTVIYLTTLMLIVNIDSSIYSKTRLAGRSIGSGFVECALTFISLLRFDVNKVVNKKSEIAYSNTSYLFHRLSHRESQCRQIKQHTTWTIEYLHPSY